MAKQTDISKAIKGYLREVERTRVGGKATEHSYRHALKTLIESFGPRIVATNEPKRVKCGAPDFIVERGDASLGYVECKDIGIALDDVEKSDQLRRYLDSLDNLILTDYIEFRYYVSGQQRMHVLLAREDARGKLRGLQGAELQLASLIHTFLSAKPEQIGTPKELAARMANIAKVIRDAIERAFGLEDAGGTLHGELDGFRRTILNDITPEQFADMYAQTVCYGMFSARVNVPDKDAKKFTREHAAYDLPATNPFLREMFDYIAGTHLDPSIVWAVDMLAETLRRAAMGPILRDFTKAKRREDPIVHFYETFLAAYDPKLRKTRGVYYTPQPVVSYIVRSIDAILKHDFNCPDGLADNTKIDADFTDPGRKNGKTKRKVHRVQILDPATGTGTFLYESVRLIHDAMRASRGAWAGERGYVTQHLLPRVFGFELMMAPYAVAHMKLGWLLKDTGYNFPKGDRLRVYLTNTLEEAEYVAMPLFAFANQIAREANAASEVKSDCPIMVVMGNPPYSGLSANMNEWVDGLLKKPLPVKGGAASFYEVDGQPLGERKLWLQDDYVKFIRFAQYRIELTGYGVLGFVTNHGYLDNPTFRGMRQSLMQTFDDIYVINLHGSSKKKERPPDGGRDDNVFDIQQGVAIGIFVKRKNGRATKPATVRHAELWGPRREKYDWLNRSDVGRTKWRRLEPNSPHYFFVPRNGKLRAEYEAWPRLTDVFARSVAGIITARDHFAVDFDDESLLGRIGVFRDPARSDSDIRNEFFAGKGSARYPSGDTRSWKLAAARQTARNDSDWLNRTRDILYRPFDVRRVYYAPWIVDWPRSKLMPTVFAEDNITLCTTRSVEIGRGWEHVLCSRHMIQHHTVSLKEVNYVFPTYLYPQATADFGAAGGWPTGKHGRRPNLKPDGVELLSTALGMEFVADGRGDLKKTFGPENIIHYAYAVFHCPTFRSRYAELLKIDFARLPLTSDKKLFARLCELGEELVGLHLVERVPTPRATYPREGSNLVERTGKNAYKPPTDQAPGRVYVNKDQYFENVPPEVWEFHVGGYQVCQKWLKDRKGRTLSFEDIEHYRKVTEAIRQTIRLMAEIDAAIPGWPLS